MNAVVVAEACAADASRESLPAQRCVEALDRARADEPGGALRPIHRNAGGQPSRLARFIHRWLMELGLTPV